MEDTSTLKRKADEIELPPDMMEQFKRFQEAEKRRKMDEHPAPCVPGSVPVAHDAIPVEEDEDAIPEEDILNIGMKNVQGVSRPLVEKLSNYNTQIQKSLEANYPKYYWGTFIFSCVDYVCPQYKSVLQPYEGENRAAKPIPMEIAQMPLSLMDRVVSKWTITKTTADKLERTNIGKGVINLRNGMNKFVNSNAKNIYVVAQHVGECMGHAHFHVLMGSPTPIRQTNVCKSITADKCAPWVINRHTTEYPAWALMNMIQPSEKRLFLGTNDHNMLEIIQGTFAGLKRAAMEVPIPPNGEYMQEPEMDEEVAQFIRGSEGSAFINDGVSACHSIHKRAMPYAATKEFLMSCFAYLKITTFDKSKVRMLTHRLPVRLQNLFDYLMSLQASSDSLYAYAQHLTKMGVYMQAENYCPDTDEGSVDWLSTLEPFKDMTHKDQIPLWFLSACVVCDILLGLKGKQNTIFVSGPVSSGKTMIFNRGMLWLAPVVYPTVNSDPHAFEELHKPHALAICDEQQEIWPACILEKLKQMMGGCEFPLNVKYNTGCVASKSPVIWISQTNTFHLGGVTEEHTHRKAFEVRQYNVDTRKSVYPFTNNDVAWKLFWPFLVTERHKYNKDKAVTLAEEEMKLLKFVNSLHDNFVAWYDRRGNSVSSIDIESTVSQFIPPKRSRELDQEDVSEWVADSLRHRSMPTLEQNCTTELHDTEPVHDTIETDDSISNVS